MFQHYKLLPTERDRDPHPASVLHAVPGVDRRSGTRASPATTIVISGTCEVPALLRSWLRRAADQTSQATATFAPADDLRADQAHRPHARHPPRLVPGANCDRYWTVTTFRRRLHPGGVRGGAQPPANPRPTPSLTGPSSWSRRRVPTGSCSRSSGLSAGKVGELQPQPGGATTEGTSPAGGGRRLDGTHADHGPVPRGPPSPTPGDHPPGGRASRCRASGPVRPQPGRPAATRRDRNPNRAAWGRRHRGHTDNHGHQRTAIRQGRLGYPHVARPSKLAYQRRVQVRALSRPPQQRRTSDPVRRYR